jgi:hypothetical protein
MKVITMDVDLDQFILIKINFFIRQNANINTEGHEAGGDENANEKNNFTAL